MELTRAQLNQLEKQKEAHKHGYYTFDFELDKDVVLEEFAVYRGVLRPELVTSAHLARWLFENREFYSNKTVCDVGSGTGIQGIVTGLFGARHVIFTDVGQSAYENTIDNARKFLKYTNWTAYQRDLFSYIGFPGYVALCKCTEIDAFVFNHPFFPKEPDHWDKVERAMCDDGKLIHRFFKDAGQYWTKKGPIIMPFYHRAGDVNNPAVQAPKHGYRVVEKMKKNVETGLQKGRISIYELTK
jgi:methylase of polypeptide subunit release factors